MLKWKLALKSKTLWKSIKLDLRGVRAHLASAEGISMKKEMRADLILKMIRAASRLLAKLAARLLATIRPKRFLISAVVRILLLR